MLSCSGFLGSALQGGSGSSGSSSSGGAAAGLAPLRQEVACQRKQACQGAAVRRAGSQALTRSYQDDKLVSEDKRRYLLKFVQTCEADLLEDAPWPTEVEDAMLLTAQRLFPALPPQYEVSVKCSGSSLADLVYTSLVTGYLCGRVWETLQRTQRQPPAITSGPPSSETQSTAEYMYQLEGELVELRQKLQGKDQEERTGNALLDFLARSDADELHAYTSDTCAEVREAFNSFVYRALGAQRSLSHELHDHKAKDLSHLVFFSELVGFTLRQLEVNFENERSLLLSYASLDSVDIPALSLEGWQP